MLARSPSTSVHGSVELSWMNSMLPPADDVDAALAAVLQPHQDLVLDLHVPGIVVFAGLQHRARRRHRVAAALHLDRVEVRAGSARGSSGLIAPATMSPGLKSTNL